MKNAEERIVLKAEITDLYGTTFFIFKSGINILPHLVNL